MEYLISVLIFLDHGNEHSELTVVGRACLLGLSSRKPAGQVLTQCNAEWS